LDFKEQEYIEYDEGIQQTKTTGTQPKKKISAQDMAVNLQR
jgi:hypothetical protein